MMIYFAFNKSQVPSAKQLNPAHNNIFPSSVGDEAKRSAKRIVQEQSLVAEAALPLDH